VNETELSKLVVRLVGDPANLLASLKKVQEESHKTRVSMEELGKKAVDFTKDIGKDVANRVLGGFGFGALAGGVATGLVHLFENASEVAERYEKVEIGLNTTLRANYRNVTETTESYEKFAEEMDKTTTASRLQTLSMLKLAEAHRLTGDAAKNAAREAIALSGGGRDPESMLRITAAVNEGNIQQAMAYGRLLPELRGIKNEEEYLVEYYHQVNVKMEEQNRLIDTSGEKWKKSKEEMDRAEVGLGRIANKMAEITLQVAKWGAKKTGSPVLALLDDLGGHKHAMVELTEEARDILREEEERVNREKARAALAVSGSKDLKEWIADLKEEAKYADLATEAEKRRRKDMERGAYMSPLLAELDELIAKTEKLTKAGQSKKGLKDLVDTLSAEQTALLAKAQGEWWWNDQLEKLAKNLPAGSRLVEFVRRLNKETAELKEFQQIADKFATPEEKFIKEQEKLFQVLVLGKGRWDLYGRAVEEASKRLLGAAAASKDAVEYGAEAISRISEFMDKNTVGRNMIGGILPPGVQQGPMPRVVGEDFGGHGWGMGPGDEIVEELKKVNEKLAGPGVKIVKSGGFF
jgi:hypothetical protein